MSAYTKQIGGDHYQRYAVQPFEFFDRWKVPWGEAYSMKYIMRHRWKNGEQDLQKAFHCLDLIIDKHQEHAIESTRLYQNDDFFKAYTDYYQIMRNAGLPQPECNAVMYILHWINGGDVHNLFWAQLEILDILERPDAEKK